MSTVLHRGGPEWKKKHEIVVLDTEDKYYDDSELGGMVAAFACTPSGRPSKLTPAQQATWDRYANDPRYEFSHVEVEEKTYTPTVVKCNCGTHVEIYSDADDCPTCHQVYNLWGQELAPPSQWEREDYEATFGPLGPDDSFYWEEMYY